MSDSTSSTPEENKTPPAEGPELFPLEQGSGTPPKGQIPPKPSRPSRKKTTSTSNQGRIPPTPTVRPSSGAGAGKKKFFPLSTGKMVYPSKPKQKLGCFTWILISILIYLFLNNTILKNGCNRLIETIETVSDTTGSGEERKQDFDTFKEDKKILDITTSNLKFPVRFTDDPDKRVYGSWIILDTTDKISRVYFVGIEDAPLMHYEQMLDTGMNLSMFLKTELVETQIKESASLSDEVELETENNELVQLSLKDVRYYEEVEIRCMADNKRSYRKNQTELIRMPRYVYQQILEGRDISYMYLYEIPESKVTRSLRRKLIEGR